MIIGAVKEKKKFENRVSISPDDVKNYVKAGHQVFIEKGAGSLSGFNDKSYKESGATLSTSKEVFNNSDIILKINCPTPDESKLIKNNSMVIFPGWVEHGVRKVTIKDSDYFDGWGRYCISSFFCCANQLMTDYAGVT